MPFTRKLNVVKRYGRSSGSGTTSIPSRLPAQTVVFIEADQLVIQVIFPYSYGDSAGITPVFPFNPPLLGGETRSAANVVKNFNKRQANFAGIIHIRFHLLFECNDNTINREVFRELQLIERRFLIEVIKNRQ